MDLPLPTALIHYDEPDQLIAIAPAPPVEEHPTEAATTPLAVAEPPIIETEPDDRLMEAVGARLPGLLKENRSGTAYHLVRALEASGHSAPVPSPLLRALALVPALLHKREQVQPLLETDYIALLESPSDDLSTGLLQFAAAIVPALLVPDLGAADLLALCPLPEGCPNLHALLRTIRDFANHQIPLDPALVHTRDDAETWRREHAAIRDEFRTWYAAAQRRKFDYVPAHQVWEYWQRPEELLGQLSVLIEREDGDTLAALDRWLASFGSADIIRREIDRTDRQKLHRPIAGNTGTIDGSYRDRLISGTTEVTQLARRYRSILAARPTGRDVAAEYHVGRARSLRQEIVAVLPDALSELTKLVAPDTSLLASAIDCAIAALDSLSSLLSDPAAIERLAPPPQILLNGDLPRIPALRLTETWEPIGDGIIPAEILSGAIGAIDTPWDAAFEARLVEGDFVATNAIRDEVARRGDPLAQQRSASWNRRQSIKHQELSKHLGGTLDALAAAIERAVQSSALDVRARDERANHVERLKAHLPTIRQFAPIHEEIARAHEELRAREDQLLFEARKKLDQLPRASTSEKRRLIKIRQALEMRDLLAANEYIALAQDRQDPPDQLPIPTDILSHFVPRLDELAELLADRPHAEGTVSQLRQGRPIVSLVRSKPERSESADWWKICLDASRIRGGLGSVEAGKLLTGLGFRNVKASLAPGRESRSGRFTATPVANRDICSLPAYGSLANGNYRLYAIWDVHSADEVLDLVGDATPGAAPPPIVLAFTPLALSFRLDLAARCRARRRTVLVVDLACALYLALRPTAERLASMFACTLPFTYSEAYVTATGDLPAELFYGRDAALRDIRNPTGAAIIYGGRQLGKTALLRYAANRYQTDTTSGRAIFIDLSRDSIDTPEDPWKVLAERLVAATDAAQPAPAHTPAALQQWIRTWLMTDISRSLLILLDEADRFLQADAMAGYLAVRQLQSLTDAVTPRRCKVVLAGLHDVQRVARDPNQPLTNFGSARAVGTFLLDGEAVKARELLTRPLAAAGFVFADENDIARLLGLANYYPSLLQIIGRNLAEQAHDTVQTDNPPPWQLDRELVERVIRKPQVRDDLANIFTITLDLDDRYKCLSYIIANQLLDAPDPVAADSGFPASELAVSARYYWPGAFAHLQDEAIDTLLDELVGLGILRQSAQSGDTPLYTLRSRNILPLFGSPDRIADALLAFESAMLDRRHR